MADDQPNQDRPMPPQVKNGGSSSHILLISIVVIAAIVVAGVAYFAFATPANPLLQSLLSAKGQIPLSTVSNMITQGVASPSQINITYAGNITIIGKSGLTTTTISLPYNLSYKRLGSSSRMYFETAVSSSGLSLLQPPASNSTPQAKLSPAAGSISSYTILNATIIKNSNLEYVCSNLFSTQSLYSSFANVTCMDNATLRILNNASSSGYSSTYSDTSLKDESGKLFRNSSINLTVTSLSAATYRGMPCTQVGGLIVGKIAVNYSSPFSSVFSSIGAGVFSSIGAGSSYLNYTINVSGSYSACLSKSNGYLPLNLSFTMNFKNGQNNTVIKDTMFESAMGKVSNESALSALPGKLLNLTALLPGYCFPAYYNNLTYESQLSCSNPIMNTSGSMRIMENLSSSYSGAERILATGCSATNGTSSYYLVRQIPSAAQFVRMNFSLPLSGYQNQTLYFNCNLQQPARLGSSYSFSTWALIQIGSQNYTMPLGTGYTYVTTNASIGRQVSNGPIPAEVSIPPPPLGSAGSGGSGGGLAVNTTCSTYGTENLGSGWNTWTNNQSAYPHFSAYAYNASSVYYSECQGLPWHGVQYGVYKDFNISSSASSLGLSMQYYVYSGTNISSVTNAWVRVINLATNKTVLDTSLVYGGTTNTGTQNYYTTINSGISGAGAVRVELYTINSWLDDWNQYAYFNNVAVTSS